MDFFIAIRFCIAFEFNAESAFKPLTAKLDYFNFVFIDSWNIFFGFSYQHFEMPEIVSIGVGSDNTSF